MVSQTSTATCHILHTISPFMPFFTYLTPLVPLVPPAPPSPRTPPWVCRALQFIFLPPCPGPPVDNLTSCEVRPSWKWFLELVSSPISVAGRPVSGHRLPA